VKTGWFKESYRHSLAARGVRTSYFVKKRYAADKDAYRAEYEELAKRRVSKENIELLGRAQRMGVEGEKLSAADAYREGMRAIVEKEREQIPIGDALQQSEVASEIRRVEEQMIAERDPGQRRALGERMQDLVEWSRMHPRSKTYRLTKEEVAWNAYAEDPAKFQRFDAVDAYMRDHEVFEKTQYGAKHGAVFAHRFGEVLGGLMQAIPNPEPEAVRTLSKNIDGAATLFGKQPEIVDWTVFDDATAPASYPFRKRRFAAAEFTEPKKVDLKKYAGTWKQVRVENEPWFQKGCADVTAKYVLNKDGTVTVTNTCGKRSIEGTAKSVSRDNRKLEVSFGFPFPKGEYVIEHVNPTYTKAVVRGGKTRWELQKIEE
jgi:hypothetical protein